MPDSPLEVPIEISDAGVDEALRRLNDEMAKTDRLAGSLTDKFKDQAKAISKGGSGAKGSGGLWSRITDPNNLGAHLGALTHLGAGIVGGQGAAGAISGLGNLAGSIGSQAGGLVGNALLPGIGEIIGSQIGSAIGPLVSGLSSALEKAAPAAMKQLDMALDDISAVIGQVFAPALQMAIPPVRLFGDILATILPNAQEVGEATQELQTIIGDMMVSVREVVGDVGPLLRGIIIEDLKLFAKALDWATRDLRYFMIVFSEIVDAITGGPGEKGVRSSQGYAAKQAQFTSFAGYQQAFQTAALMSGKGGPTQANMPAYVNDIRKDVRAMLKPLRDLSAYVQQILLVLPGSDNAKQRAAIEAAKEKAKEAYGGRVDEKGRPILSPDL